MGTYVTTDGLDNVSNFLFELSELSEKYGVAIYNHQGLSKITDLECEQFGNFQVSDYQTGHGYVLVSDS